MNRTSLVVNAVIGLLICGCVTHRVTPTSYSRDEAFRRELASIISPNMSTDSIFDTMSKDGFSCEIVRGGRFNYSTSVTTADTPNGLYDYVLCEKPFNDAKFAKSQAAIILSGNKTTGDILVNAYCTD